MYLCVVLIAALCLGESAAAKSNYVVIVPSVVRPGRNLDLSIQVFQEGIHEVKAKLVNENSEDRTLQMVVDGVAAIEMQGSMALEIPEDLTANQYKVYVEITNPDNSLYMMNTTVNTVFKTLSIYLITDKAMYKPGDLVRLRAMSVYSDLLPYGGTLDIIITDPNDSRIKQWIGMEHSSGVVSEELQLSDQPVLGDWTIEVTTVTNEKKKMTFTVAEYVLPKYDVKLTLPSFLSPEMDAMKVGVEAKYTFGQPVKGQADLMIKLQTYGSYEINQYDMPTMQKTVELVKGRAEISLTIEELVTLAGTRRCYYSSCYSDQACVRNYAVVEQKLAGRIIEVNATVKETLTGKNFSTTSTMKVVSYPYQVAFLDFTPTNFKAGLPWVGMVQLKKVDNSPPSVKDLKNHMGRNEPLHVSYKCSVKSYLDDKVTEELTINPSGFIPVTFSPHENATYCQVEVQFKFAQARRTLSKYLSKEANGLQVSLPDQKGPVQPDTTTLFKVISTESTTEIFIQFLSKGRIVDQRTHKVEESMTEFYIPVEMNKDLCRRLAPSPRIFVWMITESGEFIVDTLDFTMDGVFTNEVSVDFSTGETEPGQDVSLTVSASPQSYVGLLAVDQSVRLLKGGSDITEEMVMRDLSQYDAGNGYIRPYYGRFYCWWPIYRGGKDTSEVIDNAGVNVMTDSSIYQYNYCYNCGWVGRPDAFFSRGPVGQAGAPAAGPSGPMGEAGAPGAPAIAESSPQDVDLPPEPSSGEEEQDLKEPGRIRTDFPETWLWQDFVTGPDGHVSVETQVPDTITSWVASAFALHQQDGLGVASHTAQLTVAKPFFAQLVLPYSMIRGEEVALKVTVFNYLPQDITAVVTLKASDQFQVRHPDFIEPISGEDIVKDIFIESGDGVLVSFWIVPTDLGQIPVSVETRSAMAADALTKDILVEPEGQEVENTEPFLITLNDGDQLHREEISIQYPSVVEGSERALFTVYGDIMGPSLNGLDKLLRMPYGCGEQNMINFAPSIYILTYLEQTNTVTAEIKAKAEKVMESGYQRELSYHRKDGSFSAFGDRDDSGSTWLTAFVIRCFNQAKPFITIDQTVIDRAVNFIIMHQDRDGSFIEPGRVLNSRLQSGSGKGASLTAYITAALIENKHDLAEDILYNVETRIQLALRYLEQQLEDIKEDPYVLSLVTFTLTLGRSSKSAMALQYLNDQAMNEGQETYWKKEEEAPVNYYWWRYRPANAYNIEMTSYGLMTYAANNMLVEGARVVSWLAKQRNSLGGYRSTQDTVLALQSMSAFQSLVGPTSEQDIDIILQVDDMQHTFQSINSENALLLQSYEVPAAINNVTIEATGKGIALLQMSIFYHQLETQAEEGLEINVVSTTENNEVVTEVCVRWVREEESGMVVIEMGQLTAYEPIIEDLVELYGALGLKRVEVSDRKLTLYLDEVTIEDLCMSVTSVNVSPVTNLQRALIMGYQYYAPDVSTSVTYVPDGLNESDNDFCAACPECCEGPLTTVAPEVEGVCATNPCQNGGLCRSDFDMYICQCRNGHTGNNCQYKIDKAPKVLDLKDENGGSNLSHNCALLAALSALMFAWLL